MKIKLLTFSNNLNTIGNIYINDELICSTIERPWLENKINVSCVPSGEYQIKPVNSPRFGLTYEVCNVEGRSHILFHKGNFVSDSHGCIMPCCKYGILKGEFAGLSSKPAYDKLMSILAGDEHKLTIQRY